MIEVEGKIGGQRQRLTWDEGTIGGDFLAVKVFGARAGASRGRTARFPEAGSVKCDPKTPWGFWAIAVGCFDAIPDLTGDLPPIDPGEVPEDAVF